MELNVFDPLGIMIAHLQFKISHQKGVGYTRNTPEFLRYVAFMQWLVDPADPINFAQHWKGKNVLIQVALGDWTVPVSTGINLARVAGMISPERTKWLIKNNIQKGVIMDVDQLYPVESTSGSAVRFHPSGKHEYLVIPNMKDPNMMKQTQITQDQVVRYFLSHGKHID